MREKILIALFLSAVFVNFLGPIIDCDFPFHLKTGEYIFQHREIPKDDPFSFYGEGIVTQRERFILSQYWLAQVILYKLYSVMGVSGVILLRAAVFSAFVFLIWYALKGKGIYSSFIIAMLVVFILQQSKLDRPQYFSFIFNLVVVLLFERFRERPVSMLPLYFIPPLMLLWANMHGGFVFGIAVILIYALSEALKLLANKPALIGQPLGKKSALIFFLIGLLAILCSYINPVMNEQILTTIESHTVSNWLFSSIKEYASPITEMASPFSMKISIISFWILFGFISIIVLFNLLRKGSADVTVISLLIFSSLAAFTAIRYIPFFVAVALPLSRDYRFFESADFMKGIKRTALPFLFATIFILAIGFGIRDRSNLLAIGKHTGYPEGAVKFLQDNRMAEGVNIFNQTNRGSYLLWMLYPSYRIFTDTRYISMEAVRDADAISYARDDYNQPNDLALGEALSALAPEGLGKINVSSDFKCSRRAGKPLWKMLLDQYKIDFIVHEACGDFTRELYPLTLRLLRDDDWVLIYMDGIVQIFIRDKEKYSEIIRRFRLPKELIYDEIILETTPLVRKKIPVARAYSSLAFALTMKGKDKDAKTMIEAAIELNKDDLVAHFSKAYLILKK